MLTLAHIPDDSSIFSWHEIECLISPFQMVLSQLWATLSELSPTWTCVFPLTPIKSSISLHVSLFPPGTQSKVNLLFSTPLYPPPLLIYLLIVGCISYISRSGISENYGERKPSRGESSRVKLSVLWVNGWGSMQTFSRDKCCHLQSSHVLLCGAYWHISVI